MNAKKNKNKIKIKINIKLIFNNVICSDMLAP